MPVISASSPADCFDVAQEAWRIATRYMTPVFLLTDGYIANGSEPWKIPEMADLKKIDVTHPAPIAEGETFQPYERNEQLARPWALPGTPTLEHRLGGIEKQTGTGNISYNPENHQQMTDTREAKVANIANDIPEQEVSGPESGDLLVLSWGGTYGTCFSAVRRAQKAGKAVAHAHLRYLYPFPKNLGQVIKNYKKVLMPELNKGQLRMMVRDQFLVDAIGFNKVQGKPFSVGELEEKIYETIG